MFEALEMHITPVHTSDHSCGQGSYDCCCETTYHDARASVLVKTVNSEPRWMPAKTAWEIEELVAEVSLPC